MRSDVQNVDLGYFLAAFLSYLLQDSGVLEKGQVRIRSCRATQLSRNGLTTWTSGIGHCDELRDSHNNHHVIHAGNVTYPGLKMKGNND